MVRMADISRGRGRPSVKRDHILSSLRADIVSGRAAPGSRLPSRAELQARYAATADTLQQAMRVLQEDGLLEVRGNLGTFVAERPPHLSHYALVCTQDPRRMRYWSYFYKAIAQSAAAIADERVSRFESYYIQRGDPRSPDFARLMRDVTRHRLAGIIYMVHPFELGNAVLDRLDGIPQVAIASDIAFRGMPVVYPDHRGFFRRAASYLAERGRKRVALVSFPEAPFNTESYEQACINAGLGAPKHWQYNSNVETGTVTISHAVQTVLSLPPDQRPDALMISDDNLVECATAGVAATHLRVGADLDIAAYCNFPVRPPASTPVTRFGCDVGRLLHLCMDRIDSQRRGDPFERSQICPLLSESEFHTASAATSAGVVAASA